MLVTMKQAGLYTVAANTDIVLAAFPMPPGSRFVNIQGSVDYGVAAPAAFDKVQAAGLAGFVLPVLDPDAAQNIDTMWDMQVPKDETQVDDAIDLDQATGSDPTPEWEPGSPDLITIVGLDQAPQWFRRRDWLSINTHPLGVHFNSTLQYLPGSVVPIKAQPRIRSDMYSMAVLGFSAPVTDVVTTTVRTAPTKQQWGMLMFLEETITNMMQLLFSFVEAGAESPYEDASTFLAFLTEPAVEEQSGRSADFASTTYNVNIHVTAQIVMPDHKSSGNLGSG